MDNTSPIFFQFGKVNALDVLIEQFKIRKWKIDSKVSLHKYHWPEIVLSEKIIKIKDPISKQESEEHSRIIELMGCYQPKCNDWCNEGEIVLYYEKIKKVAEEFLKENSQKKYTATEIIEILSVIVLIHEFVHWIMHWVECPNGNKFIPFDYDSDDTVYFHEGFAQFFTRQIISTYPKVIKIFEWLEDGQPCQYKKYKELKIPNNENLITMERGIEIIEFLRRFQVQSFKIAIDLNAFIDMGNSNMNIEKFWRNVNLHNEDRGICGKILKVYDNYFPNLNEELRGKINGCKFNV